MMTDSDDDDESLLADAEQLLIVARLLAAAARANSEAERDAAMRAVIADIEAELAVRH
jgi:hypothetical protein